VVIDVLVIIHDMGVQADHDKFVEIGLADGTAM
jgi:hypothetical protein